MQLFRHCKTCVSKSWQSLSFNKPEIATNSASSRNDEPHTMLRKSLYYPQLVKPA